MDGHTGCLGIAGEVLWGSQRTGLRACASFSRGQDFSSREVRQSVQDSLGIDGSGMGNNKS